MSQAKIAATKRNKILVLSDSLLSSARVYAQIQKPPQKNKNVKLINKKITPNKTKQHPPKSPDNFLRNKK